MTWRWSVAAPPAWEWPWMLQRAACGWCCWSRTTLPRARRHARPSWCTAGVRYLAQGNIGLVREALHERTTLLHNAPHLAQPLAFVMPSYHWWETPFYGAGLVAYDALAGKAGLGRTQFLGKTATLKYLPTARTQGLKGGVRYWDGQFNDARLAVALARTAALEGALLVNYCEVTGLRLRTRASQWPRLPGHRGWAGVRHFSQMCGQRHRCVGGCFAPVGRRCTGWRKPAAH